MAGFTNISPILPCGSKSIIYGQRTLSQGLIRSRSLRNFSQAQSIRCLSSTSGRDVRIVEVSARDGLQNIKQSIPTATKIELIRRLADTGLHDIEATSFVSPKWVPQLADGAEVMSNILPMQSTEQKPYLRFPVLAPNWKGLENASKANAKEIVVFASITEAFSKANQNCTVEEALLRAEKVTKEALQRGIKVRGVVSCIFSDPISGPTDPKSVLPVVQRLLDMGCYEVGLGDTLGVGTSRQTQTLLEILLKDIPSDKLAGHFHDTYGQAIANIFKAYEMGIRTFDSSVAGLGGCPYAPGAKGNVATEDVIYSLENSGISTGVDLEKLIPIGQWISQQIGIPYGSRAGAALAAKCKPATPQVAKSPPKTRRTWEVVHDANGYIVSRSGTAMKITLNRPKNGNAFTNEMLLGLTKLFRDLANDPSVYHVVLSSQGKYFCTGMDLSGNTETTDISEESSYFQKNVDLFEAIDHAPQTTIALVDGPAFGGGVGVTFACDVRIVSPRARWTLSEIKIGVSPAIISKYLVREWGTAMAREGMLSGREIHPEELHRVGAIHAISSSSETLDEKLDDYLDQLQKAAPKSAAINKELARLGWKGPEGEDQKALIKQTFGNMMVPGSEGEHGIGELFRKKSKKVDWAAFWNGRHPANGVKSY